MFKKVLIILVAAVFCITLFAVYHQTQAGGNLCFMCSSGSSCNYCVSPSGSDSQKDREYCKKKGCKISGTTSCPSAANYKYCR